MKLSHYYCHKPVIIKPLISQSRHKILITCIIAIANQLHKAVGITLKRFRLRPVRSYSLLFSQQAQIFSLAVLFYERGYVCADAAMCAVCTFTFCTFFTIYLFTSPTGGAAGRSVPAIRVNWLLIFHSTFYLGAVNLKARKLYDVRPYCLRKKMSLIHQPTIDCTALNSIAATPFTSVPCLTTLFI